MSMRLLVENIGESMHNLQLEQLFSPHGRVSSAQIDAEEIGGNERCGHVQMNSEEDARRAIAALNGQLIDGRLIEVSIVEPSAEPVIITRPRYGNGRSGGGGVRSGRRA